MTRASIDRVGPYGKKRTWHSLRHTYARLWIEGGGNIYALSAQLGHSSVRVTTDRYGHFSRKASKLEAETGPKSDLDESVQTDVQTEPPRGGSVLLKPAFLQWARLDSNQGPTDYESAALTS